jgi:hypothetical protein
MHLPGVNSRAEQEPLPPAYVCLDNASRRLFREKGFPFIVNWLKVIVQRFLPTKCFIIKL